MSTDLNLTAFHPQLQKGKPFVIAGPCSAESRDQVLATAEQLAQSEEVKLFRAGVWKPRTRPNSFEGIGENGLKWLQEVQDKFKLEACIEVAKPQHVEACLAHQIKTVWIGARTTANPFSIQELAEALKGTDMRVMVKNPLHPDLELWLGAIERINRAGVSKIAAVHRGFYTYENTPFRNLPMWEIPIELKRLHPDLPLLCDPSHICGNTELIYSVAQKAYDLAFDGLMIESHTCPNEAWTDAKQQIQPSELKDLLTKLIRRNEKGDELFESQLDELRYEINHIDQELLTVLSRRMQKTIEIGYYKKEHNITVLQIERLREMVINRLQNGQKLGLDKLFVSKLLQLVHKESVQIQSQIMLNKKEKS